MRASKTCSRDDCEGKVVARGLCHNHYEQWHKKLPAKLGMEDSSDAILAQLPATAHQIASECGLTYEGARKALAKLCKAGRAHIGKMLPPGEESPTRWVRLYAAGPGIDATLSKQKRRATRKKNRRAYEASKRVPKPDLLLAAFFKPNHNNQETRSAN